MGKPRHSCDPPQNPYIDYVEITTTTAGPTPKENIDLIRYPDSVPCPIAETESCIDLLYNNCEGGIYTYCVINTESQDVHTMTFTFELTEDSPKLFADFTDEKIKKFVLTLIWPATQGLAHSFPRNKIPLFSGPFSTLVPKSTFAAFDFSDEEVLSGSANNWSATGDVEFEIYCEILKDKFSTDRIGSEIVFDISFNPEFVTEIPQELEEDETENTDISIFASSSSVTENTYDTNHTTNFPESWFSDFNPGNFLRVFDTNYGGEVYKYYDDCINGALSATITIDSSVDCRVLQIESVSQLNRCLSTDGGIMQFSNCKEGRTHNILVTTKTKYLCTDTSFQPRLLAGYISTNEHQPCDCSAPIIQPPPQPPIPPEVPPSRSFDVLFGIEDLSAIDGWGQFSGFNAPSVYITIKNNSYKNTGVNSGTFQFRIVDDKQDDQSTTTGETSLIDFTKINESQYVNLGGYMPTDCYPSANIGVGAGQRCKELTPCARETTLIITDIFGQSYATIARWIDRIGTCP